MMLRKTIASKLQSFRLFSSTAAASDYKGSATVENRERKLARKMKEKGLDVAQTGPTKIVNNTL